MCKKNISVNRSIGLISGLKELQLFQGEYTHCIA